MIMGKFSCMRALSDQRNQELSVLMLRVSNKREHWLVALVVHQSWCIPWLIGWKHQDQNLLDTGHSGIFSRTGGDPSDHTHITMHRVLTSDQTPSESLTPHWLSGCLASQACVNIGSGLSLSVQTTRVLSQEQEPRNRQLLLDKWDRDFSLERSYSLESQYNKQVYSHLFLFGAVQNPRLTFQDLTIWIQWFALYW